MEIVALAIRPVGAGQVAPDGTTAEAPRWAVTVGAPGAPGRHGLVPGASVLAATEAVEALMTAEGADALTAAEAVAARALSAAVDASGSPADLWFRARSRAEGRREPLLVVLDADEALRPLPWELLALGHGRVGGMDTDPKRTSYTVVVRLVRLAPAPSDPPAGAISVVVGRLGTPAPELDPTIAALVEACRASGLPDPSGMDVPPGPRVVNLVGADTADTAAGTLLTSTNRTPADELIAGSQLVVLASTGLSPGRALRNLAARAVLAGATAAAHTDGGVAPDALRTWLPALHRAVGAGVPLVRTMIAAREAVADAALPTSDARWWRFRLLVGRPEAAARIPRPTPWRPRSWPQPAADAMVWLDRAAHSADASAGFVGVEHLLHLWVSAQAPGTDARADALRPHLTRWVARLARLTVREDEVAVAHRPTPRLAGLARVLAPGFDTEALLDALLSDPDGWGRWLDPDRDFGPAAHDLAVLGGPEDGRRLDLSPGDVVGRAAPDRPGAALYADTVVTDVRVSRQHLVWHGQGRVEILGKVSPLDAITAEPGGIRTITVGELLAVTEATWLIGVGPREPRAGVS